MLLKELYESMYGKLLKEYWGENPGEWVLKGKKVHTKDVPFLGKYYVGVNTSGNQPPMATPKQKSFAKKYKILSRSSVPGIDFDFIKKNNLEKLFKRKRTSPIVLKIAKEFSKEIKNANGNINQVKNKMKKHFSKSDGWVTGNPLNDYIKYGGITVKADSGIVSVKDLAAMKGFDIDLKTGKFKGTMTPERGEGSPYEFSQKPAGNEYEAKAGGNTGYWDGW